MEKLQDDYYFALFFFSFMIIIYFVIARKIQTKNEKMPFILNLTIIFHMDFVII